jgi:hypothetical protein
MLNGGMVNEYELETMSIRRWRHRLFIRLEGLSKSRTFLSG